SSLGCSGNREGHVPAIKTIPPAFSIRLEGPGEVRITQIRPYFRKLSTWQIQAGDFGVTTPQFRFLLGKGITRLRQDLKTVTRELDRGLDQTWPPCRAPLPMR